MAVIRRTEALTQRQAEAVAPFLTQNQPHPFKYAVGCSIKYSVDSAGVTNRIFDKHSVGATVVVHTFRMLRRTNHTSPAIPASHPACPYCGGGHVVGAGTRKNRTATVKRYSCIRCARTFTDRPSPAIGTTYPLHVIIDALSLYNRGYTLNEAAKRAGKRHRLTLSAQLVSSWKNRYRAHIPYLKARDAVTAAYPPHTLIHTTRLHHGQVYDFAYHRGKLARAHAHNPTLNVPALASYLTNAPTDTPHDLFRTERPRASQQTVRCSLNEVAITERTNAAVEMAAFAVPAAPGNSKRHETIQTFMLVNDLATVAMEVPIYLTHADLRHYRERLGFSVPFAIPHGEAITGHIDLLQVRNGKVYIVDYKPDAKHDKPIEQLMVYALALARRTGLRLLDFMCAWFDDLHYYEFAPLPVVHKKGALGSRTPPPRGR